MKIFENIRKNKSTILTKNKLQRIAKNKLQIGKFVKNHSGSSSSSKSLTFLLFCRNLPGKANLKMQNNFYRISARKACLCSIMMSCFHMRLMSHENGFSI